MIRIGEKVLSVDDAAERLTGLGLRFAGINTALQPPFDVDYPFSAGARSADDSMVIEVRGGYNMLLALEREMRA